MSVTIAAVASALVLVIPLTAWAGDEQQPQRPDQFLVAWVKGAASYDHFTKFHADYPRSPHKRDTEELEVAIKCSSLRKVCGEDRADSLTEDLLKLYKAEDTREGVRRGIIHVLGRIQSPKALPTLCEAARTSTGDIQAAALASLGFFGHASAEDSFMVFGGRFWSVVLPPASSEVATETLLEMLRKLRDAEPELDRSRPYRIGSLTEEKQRLQHLTDTTLEALKSHRGSSVAAAALETLKGDYRVSKAWLWEDIGDILIRNHDHVDQQQLAALLEDKRTVVRKTAAYVLGWTGDAKAVAPLIGLLDDQDSWVREQVNHALSRLSGSRPDPLARGKGKTGKEWIAALGSNGERLNPQKSPRHEDLKPGVYRIGF